MTSPLAFVSVITIGEIRRGIEIIRHRGDNPQARRLEAWLEVVLRDFDERILEFGNEEAQVWGRLRVPSHENAIDKQIAATALTHDLILVTRNVDHFKGECGSSILSIKPTNAAMRTRATTRASSRVPLSSKR
jgi:predicted nucleic acid-binding protein